MEIGLQSFEAASLLEMQSSSLSGEWPLVIIDCLITGNAIIKLVRRLAISYLRLPHDWKCNHQACTETGHQLSEAPS